MRTAIATALTAVTLAATGALVTPAVSAPTAPASAPAVEMPVVAPGRLDTVRIGDSLKSAAATDYFDLNVRTSCGRRDIWTTKPWRRYLDIYPGHGRTEGTVSSIGVFKAGIATTKGIDVGDTLGDLRIAYGDKLTGPRENAYGVWGYFVKSHKRWIGFNLDALASDGPAPSTSKINFMELSKGRKPGLLRDGC